MGFAHAKPQNLKIEGCQTGDQRTLFTLSNGRRVLGQFFSIITYRFGASALKFPQFSHF